jgi:hypothetical protein
VVGTQYFDSIIDDVFISDMARYRLFLSEASIHVSFPGRRPPASLISVLLRQEAKLAIYNHNGESIDEVQSSKFVRFLPYITCISGEFVRMAIDHHNEQREAMPWTAVLLVSCCQLLIPDSNHGANNNTCENRVLLYHNTNATCGHPRVKKSRAMLL